MTEINLQNNFHAETLMFENSLYNSSKTRPLSASSSSGGDPGTRAPMPPPPPQPPLDQRNKSDLFQDDLVVYHDLDDHATEAHPKTGSGNGGGVVVVPQKWSKLTGEANAYANGHVALDMRPLAGEANQYEDFNALKQQHKWGDQDGGGGGGGGGKRGLRSGYEDMEGYTMPSFVAVAGSSKQQNDGNPEPVGGRVDTAPLLDVDDVDKLGEEQHLNPAFQSDESPIDDRGEKQHPNPAFQSDGRPQVAPRQRKKNPDIPEDPRVEEIPETDEEEHVTSLPPAPPVPLSSEDEEALYGQDPPQELPAETDDSAKGRAKNRVRWSERDEHIQDTDNDSDFGKPEDAADVSAAREPGEPEQFHRDDNDDDDRDDNDDNHDGDDDRDDNDDNHDNHDGDDDALEFVGVTHQKPTEEDRLDFDSVGETTTDDPPLPPPPEENLWQYPEYELARLAPKRTG